MLFRSLGNTVAKKIVEALEESKNKPFSRVLFGLGIRHVGKTMAEQITAVYPSIEELSAASEEDLAAISGVGCVIAKSIFVFLHTPDNIEVLRRLQNAGFSILGSFSCWSAKAAQRGQIPFSSSSKIGRAHV